MATKKTTTTQFSVQYRVKMSKAEERTSGPDGADVIFSCGLADALADPTAAYIQGKLKATGHTGAILRELMSGNAARELNALASRP